MPKRLTPRGEAAPPVEPNIAQAAIPKKQKKASVKKPTPRVGPNTKYVRNVHGIKCRLTLESGREIELEPRGQRGDLTIVTAEEREDPKFLANWDLLFEVIEPENAKEIIAKQQINASEQGSSLWEHLRNEKGEQYEQREQRIETTFEQQGVTVGHIKETGAGRFTDKNFEVVASSAGPNIVEAPGSPGHPATRAMMDVPGNISPEEYHEFLLWKKFQAAMAAEEATPDDLRESVTIEPLKVEDEGTSAS